MGSESCRCKMDNVRAVGCEFHGEELPRPYCYVSDSASCDKPTLPAIVPGEPGTLCIVGFDSCQMYSATGPYAPSIHEDANPIIPAGVTNESMQFIQDTNDAGAEELGLVSGGNRFSAGLLEAARVSPV